MYNATFHKSTDEIDQNQWNKLNRQKNPFTSYEFHRALEKSQCVGQSTGWYPLYFCSYDQNKQLAALIICYLRTDSYGEFIFDWSWADAYSRYGLNYYPKISCSIPYSPISATKLLSNDPQAKECVINELHRFYQDNDLSSFHYLFSDQKIAQDFISFDVTERDSFQFHWPNQEYEFFEDYLKVLSKNKRKSIKKERKSIIDSELEIKRITTKNELIESLDFFYECYLLTIDKKSSHSYLNIDFFRRIFEDLPEHCLLIIACQNSTPIAASLFLHSPQTLYGRYWGCTQEVPFLHFELCLYQGIDWAIENSRSVFEAGAQGEHKRLRGFYPVLTKSLHHLKHAQFYDAVKSFIQEEARAIQQTYF